MTQDEAQKKAEKLFGKDAVAIISVDEPRRKDSTGKIPETLTKYIIGCEISGIPTYHGIGNSWEEAFSKIIK